MTVLPLIDVISHTLAHAEYWLDLGLAAGAADAEAYAHEETFVVDAGPSAAAADGASVAVVAAGTAFAVGLCQDQFVAIETGQSKMIRDNREHRHM